MLKDSLNLSSSSPQVNEVVPEVNEVVPEVNEVLQGNNDIFKISLYLSLFLHSLITKFYFQIKLFCPMN